MEARFFELIDAGCDLEQAAEACGMTAGAARRLAQRGPSAEPRRSGSGRRAVADRLTQEEAGQLSALRLAGQGVAGALQYWARMPGTKCPQWLRDMVESKGTNKHSIPPSIRKLVYAGPDAQAAHRGSKAFGDQFAVGRMDPEGVGEAGDWFVFDDMSTNHPFWFELGPRPERHPADLAAERETRNGTSDRLAARQGIMVGRQGLYACDNRTGKWLGAMLIGTAKDAYTAADILVFMRQVFETHGFPRKGIILERGSWASTAIDGMVSGDALVAGVASLGLEVVHAYTSRGKAFLEASFRQLQDLQQMDRPSLYIGRTRGEMEREARIMRALQSGARTPQAAGVWHIRDAAANTAKMMDLMDTIPRAGEHQRGKPGEVYAAAVAARPLRMPNKDDLAVFLPELLETKISGMHVQKKKDGERYRWIAPTLFGHLGNDYRVAIRFDTDRADEGCAVYNLEPVNSPRNAEGLKPGAFMGWALAADCGARAGLVSGARKAFRTRHGANLAAAREVQGAGQTTDAPAHVRPTITLPTRPMPERDAETLRRLHEFEEEQANLA